MLTRRRAKHNDILEGQKHNGKNEKDMGKDAGDSGHKGYTANGNEGNQGQDEEPSTQPIHPVVTRRATKHHALLDTPDTKHNGKKQNKKGEDGKDAGYNGKKNRKDGKDDKDGGHKGYEGQNGEDGNDGHHEKHGNIQEQTPAPAPAREPEPTPISPATRVSTLHMHPDILKAIAAELPRDKTFGIIYAKLKQLYASTRYGAPVTTFESFRRDPKTKLLYFCEGDQDRLCIPHNLRQRLLQAHDNRAYVGTDRTY
jgi:hypothetical protein